MSSATMKRSTAALAGVVVGIAAAAFFLIDPLALHPWNERWVLGAPGMDVHVHEDEGGTLWTCGMHPEVMLEEPGQCPICHMELVPLAPEEKARDSAEGEREVLYYKHPHTPGVTSPVPTKDEMGMDFIPMYADQVEAGDGPVVSIDPGMVQNMNVRTTLVRRGELTHSIRTVGYLEYDQERMVSVTTKYSGFVEKAYANYVGEPIRKGEPLLEVYSPELVQTEQELLSALEFARRMEEAPLESQRRAQALVEAARTRLGYWDISPSQVEELERSGKVFRTLTVTAPASGLIMKRMPGLEGMAVKPGMELFHIADLSTLWLSVEVFEDQVAWIREGLPAEVSLSYFPGEVFRGTVRFLEPEFDEKTRTLRVKLAVPNRQGRLRAGMYATVVFEPTAAHEAVVIPSLAVLRTGVRDVVIVEVEEGRFSPREVVLGHADRDSVEVLRGLEVGERVVTSAQFLLDSEASLQEAIQKMLAGKRGGTAEPERESPRGEHDKHGGPEAAGAHPEESETVMGHDEHESSDAPGPEKAEGRGHVH